MYFTAVLQYIDSCKIDLYKDHNLHLVPQCIEYLFNNCISCDFTVFIDAELVPLSVAGVIQR